MVKFSLNSALSLAENKNSISMKANFLNVRHTRLSALFISSVLLSGCQLIKLEQDTLNHALSNKTDSILTNAQLSDSTRSLLHVVNLAPFSCLKQVEQCVHLLNNRAVFDH